METARERRVATAATASAVVLAIFVIAPSRSPAPQPLVPGDARARTDERPPPRVAVDGAIRTSLLGAAPGVETRPPRPPAVLGAGPQTAAGVTVEGIVVRADGSPASYAHLALGPIGGGCDSQGRFRLVATPELAADAPLVAYERGVQPAVLADFGSRAKASDGTVIGPLRLDLGAPTLTITGTVVDSRRAPVKGCTIEVGTVEIGVGGRPLERLLATTPYPARTAGDGTFVLTGLLPHAYELRVTRGRRSTGVTVQPLDSRAIEVVVPDG